MEWLLLVLGFELEDGSPRPRTIFHKAYATEQACNDAGASFRGIMKRPPDEKTVSICVPREWFTTQGWQTEELG